MRRGDPHTARPIRRPAMRIDKLISECGLASRKEAAAAAKRGLVSVNGKPVKDLSAHIDPEKDAVVFAGEPVVYRKFLYLMLNKPAGYVSATEDSRFPYVVELLPPVYQRIGLFPVGRLDKDTVGLMILTNNGQLAHDLLSPRHHVEKRYRFTCEAPLSPDAEERVAAGLPIDGYVCKEATLLPDADRRGGIIVLTEGKYHQIKRMLEALDNRITSLERISFAGIPLDPALPRGAFRPLTAEEETLLTTRPDGSRRANT